jgi:hypothetical protein
VRLVVGTLVITKKELSNKVDLLHISGDNLARFGAVSPPGPDCHDTPVAKANRLHHTLNWTDESFAALVDHLLANCAYPERYQERYVINVLRDFDPNDVEPGEYRDWLVSMQAGKCRKS